jgi:epoxyqueuosine reductase
VFAGSPIKRIGRDRLVRNALIAAGNSAAPALLPAVLACVDDPAPVVRGAAAWAVRRLAEPMQLAAVRRDRLARETDDSVRAEWD